MNREQIPNTPRFPFTTSYLHVQFLKVAIPGSICSTKSTLYSLSRSAQPASSPPSPVSQPGPAPPSPAAGGARRRRTRRWSPSPLRHRRPRHEAGARLTPGGSAAASQLPPLLTSRESAHTDTSTGALGSSAAALRGKSNSYASARSCRAALLLYTGRPAAPPQLQSRPGIHAVNEKRPRETIQRSRKIYLHSSPGCAEPNRLGEAPAPSPFPLLKARDARRQPRRAPRLPRTARAAAAAAAPPHYRRTSSALCVPRLISSRNAPAMPAPRRNRPLSGGAGAGPPARPPQRRLRGIVESQDHGLGKARRELWKHPDQPSTRYGRCNSYTASPSAAVGRLLNTSRDGDSTASLANLDHPKR